MPDGSPGVTPGLPRSEVIQWTPVTGVHCAHERPVDPGDGRPLDDLAVREAGGYPRAPIGQVEVDRFPGLDGWGDPAILAGPCRGLDRRLRQEYAQARDRSRARRERLRRVVGVLEP